jgi:hypothetical protein
MPNVGSSVREMLVFHAGSSLALLMFMAPAQAQPSPSSTGVWTSPLNLQQCEKNADSLHCPHPSLEISREQFEVLKNIAPSPGLNANGCTGIGSFVRCAMPNLNVYNVQPQVSPQSPSSTGTWTSSLNLQQCEKTGNNLNCPHPCQVVCQVVWEGRRRKAPPIPISAVYAARGIDRA